VRKSARRAAAIAAAAVSCASAHAGELRYPAAARGGQVDVYHGVKVADPYRWMEDIDSPATRRWVKAESRLAARYLEALPGRAEIHRRLTDLWNIESWDVPERHGSRWFYLHNDGLQNQPVVYVATSPEGPGRVLLDPNGLSSHGAVSLRAMMASGDGRLIAYALSDRGSDWQTWHVRDVASGRDLPDVIRWSKFGGGGWRADGSGFYYPAFDPPTQGATLKSANRSHKLYFHRLGTDQKSDRLIYTRPDDPRWIVSAQVSDDGRYLIIEASRNNELKNTLLVQDLSNPGNPLVTLVAQPDADHELIGNLGHVLYVQTDDHAARGRVVAIDLDHPQPERWQTVIGESEETLLSATMVGGQVLAQYLRDGHGQVERYSAEGRQLGAVALPGLGIADGFAGHATDPESYYTFSSYTSPASVYRLDLGTGRSTLVHAPAAHGFDAASYEIRQVFCNGTQGVRVPMWIVSRRGIALDGENPTLLFGYGGFGTPMVPAFSPAIAGWLALGGVYAVAGVRGGGEYGREWHEAGIKTRKQNGFDDFIAAAQWLIHERWSRPGRLAIQGRSNGGLLVAAVEEQRPELFAAAVAQVGVMDMLRFREFTVGRNWESDYGSIDEPAEFAALLKYSPYHNVRAGTPYPATLITTGDHDDRVFPAHSFKFAAEMQHANPHGNPVILRVDPDAGHGQGKPTAQLIDETADVYAFIRNAMGLPRLQ
jgi:prolyl oligopeptidase